MVSVTEFQELSPGELCAVVGGDGVGDLKAMNNVGEELYRLLGSYVGEGSSLYPLGELVDGYQ